MHSGKMVVLKNVRDGQTVYETEATTVGELWDRLKKERSLTFKDEKGRSFRLDQPLPAKVYVIATTSPLRKNGKEIQDIEEQLTYFRALLIDLTAEEDFLTQSLESFKSTFKETSARPIEILDEMEAAIKDVESSRKKAARVLMALAERKKYLQKEDSFWSDVYAA